MSDIKQDILTQEFTILGQVIPKKNSKQIIFNSRTKKPLIISSKNYSQWHVYALWQLKQVAPVTKYPVSITMTFYVKDLRRRDLSNMAESVADTLVDARILKDDDWEHISEMILRFGSINRGNPRVKVEINPVMV